jgi:hypothetical protein
MKLPAQDAIIPVAKLTDYLLSPTHPDDSPYGRKYEILGLLTGPNGTSAWIRTIWIVLTDESLPRLVTLIPEERP